MAEIEKMKKLGKRGDRKRESKGTEIERAVKNALNWKNLNKDI